MMMNSTDDQRLNPSIHYQKCSVKFELNIAALWPKGHLCLARKACVRLVFLWHCRSIVGGGKVRTVTFFTPSLLAWVCADHIDWSK